MIRKIIEILRTIKTINRQGVDKAFKKQVIRDYFRCVVFKNSTTGTHTLSLLGYNVSYCLYDAFTYVFTDIFINNEYFFTTNNTRPVIIDCGSNIGLSVLYFKHLYPQATVLAFEPDADAFACLETNVKQNNLSDVSLHNKAVSREAGTIRFSYNAERPGAITSTTENTQATTFRDVEAVTLSDYITGTVDFMKMDIEGAETDVFHELHDSDKLKFIQQIILEYHHHLGSKMDRLSEILGILERENFGYWLQADDKHQADKTGPQLIMIHAYQK